MDDPLQTAPCRLASQPRSSREPRSINGTIRGLGQVGLLLMAQPLTDLGRCLRPRTREFVRALRCPSAMKNPGRDLIARTSEEGEILTSRHSWQSASSPLMLPDTADFTRLSCSFDGAPIARRASRLLGGSGVERHFDGKCRSVAWRAGERDRAAVGLGTGSHQRQPEAPSDALVRFWLSFEGVEDARLVIGRDRVAIVVDRDAGTIWRPFYANNNRPIGSTILQAIRDQVPERTPELLGAPNAANLPAYLEDNSTIALRKTDLLDDLLGDPAEIALVQPQWQPLSGADATDVE